MIPKIIFQTSKNIPNEKDDIYENYLSFKKYEIDDWKYEFYDNERGLKFLEENYHLFISKCFKILIPGAYKADLLRLCLLYKYGGVYADIKLMCMTDLNELIKNRNEIYVNENKFSKRLAIWNGFFATYPKNPYLKILIGKIMRNVVNLEYPDCSLCLTGPCLWGKIFIQNYKNFYLEKRILEKEENGILVLNLSLDNERDTKLYKLIIEKIRTRKGRISLNNDIIFEYKLNNSHSSPYGKLFRSKNIYDLEEYKNI